MEAIGELWQQARHMLVELLHWVEAFADGSYGSAALFVLAFLESSVFPVPPDVLLIALCLARPEHALVFALVCSIGSVLGGVGGYLLGFYGGRPLLRRLFSARRIEAVKSYYDRYNAWATGIAGLTPIPYKIFTISGGAFAIDFKIFLLASVVSRSLRFFAVAVLLYFYGEAARRFIEDYFGWLTVAFVILLIAGFYLVGKGARRAGRLPAEDQG